MKEDMYQLINQEHKNDKNQNQEPSEMKYFVI